MLRIALEMNLFGVDIVVEKNTGHYAIIDINAFPGTHSDNLIGLGRFALVSLSVVCPRLRPLLT